MPTDLPARLCPICWKPFTPTSRNPHQRFCGTDCRRENWRRQQTDTRRRQAPRTTN